MCVAASNSIPETTMPIIIDEVTADITPPPKPVPASAPGPGDTAAPLDSDKLRRELTRAAERAERTRTF
jgi:hypothetical protein